MARRKNWSAPQIVAKLWQIEVQIAQGKRPGAGLQRGGDLRAELLSLAQGVRRGCRRASQAPEEAGAGERSFVPPRGGSLTQGANPQGCRLTEVVRSP